MIFIHSVSGESYHLSYEQQNFVRTMDNNVDDM